MLTLMGVVICSPLVGEAQSQCSQVFSNIKFRAEVIRPNKLVRNILEKHSDGVIRITLSNSEAAPKALPNIISARNGFKKTIYDLLGFAIMDQVLFSKSHLNSSFNFLKLSEVLEPNTKYNMVLTGRRLFITRVKGGAINDLLTKHYFISSKNRREVRFAGEVFVSENRELILNRYSGTFRSRGKVAKESNDFFKRIFSKDIFPEDIHFLGSRQKPHGDLENINFEFRLKDLEDMRSLLTRSLREVDPTHEVKRIMGKVSAGELLNVEEFQDLKKYRRKLTLLRDSHLIFSKYGLNFLSIAYFSHILGYVNDALHFKKYAYAQKWMRHYKSMLPFFGLFHPKSFDTPFKQSDLKKYYFEVFRDISRIESRSFSITKLHKVRLAVKKLLILYNWLCLMRPLSEAEELKYQWLNKVNDRLGEINDWATGLELDGQRKYREIKVDIPADLFQTIQLLGSRGRFGIIE